MDAQPVAQPVRQQILYICGGQLIFFLFSKTRNFNFFFFFFFLSKSGCGADNEIKAREPIRCLHCGYRIMYKKRTKRSKFFLGDFTFLATLSELCPPFAFLFAMLFCDNSGAV